ncbi:hypothetical protein [Brevibacillus brevis]|uniref:hypothetical protein n=1 Tax=Brevibacillus brevis TaxID=1393 RepID=UPI00115BE161|nr:hypothetical protein [Lysinibacillus sp. SDF0063]TQR29432.1 hypothetical protein C7Y45_28975 [Lysinibacillus sp. SDF0063]
MAGAKKPDDILHIKLFGGESEKVDKIIKFFEDGRPKKFTVIEALIDYIHKQEAMNAGTYTPAPVINQQPPSDEGKSLLSKL